MQICSVILGIGLVDFGSIHCLEYFAGVAVVCSAYKSHGFVSIPYELLNSRQTMDILDNLGFVNAIALAMQLADGGQVTGGPVCSTWVWINRGTSMRTSFRPMGDRGKPSVAKGNLMVSRWAALLYIFEAFECCCKF